MEEPILLGVIGLMLGTNGVIRAKLSILQGLAQVVFYPSTHLHQAAQGTFRASGAGMEEDAIAHLRDGIDPLANGTGGIAALQGY
jgi:hypothetical protein